MTQTTNTLAKLRAGAADDRCHLLAKFAQIDQIFADMKQPVSRYKTPVRRDRKIAIRASARRRPMKRPSPYSYPGTNPMPSNPRPGKVTVDPRSIPSPTPITPLPSPMQTPASPLFPRIPGSPPSPNVRPLR